MVRVFIKFTEVFPSDFLTDISSSSTVKDLTNYLYQSNVLPIGIQSSIYFTRHGLNVNDEDQISANDTFTVNLRLKGGKGGFGSMLRALGSQIEKTTNMEACRDLSGRRMRDVNNEKKMMEWVKKKAEKDQQKEREKIEKLERQLQKPKHFFNDPDYEKSLEKTIDSVEDALKKGLAATKRNSSKLSSMKENPAPKKSKMWLGLDDLSDSSDSEDDLPPRTDDKTNSDGEAGTSSQTSEDVAEENTNTQDNKQLLKENEKTTQNAEDAAKQEAKAEETDVASSVAEEK